MTATLQAIPKHVADVRKERLTAVIPKNIAGLFNDYNTQPVDEKIALVRQLDDIIQQVFEVLSE